MVRPLTPLPPYTHHKPSILIYLYNDSFLLLASLHPFLNNFRWLSSGGAVEGLLGDWSDDVGEENVDCLTQFSGDLSMGAINCEENSKEKKIANICFAKVQME